MLRFLFILLLTFTSFNSLISQTIYIKGSSLETNSSLSISEKFKISDSKDTIIEGFYNNNTIAYRYKIFKNKPSGVYKVYHPNSTIKYLSVFVNGSLNGSWKEFNPSGKLIISGAYKNGQKDGSWFYFDTKKVKIYNEGVAAGRWRIDEGWSPRTLYKYKNGVLIDTKLQFPSKNVFY